MPSNGWFSRAFRSATGRSSKAATSGAAAPPPDVDALTREFETRARAATSSGRNIPGGPAAATLTTPATTTTEAIAPGAGVGGKNDARKMCVEDFEPLKIIGRGAFGA